MARKLDSTISSSAARPTLAASAHAQSMTGFQQRIRVGEHLLVADEPASLGGDNAGPTPLGLLVGGLAACTGTTLEIYTRRKGWEVGPIKVDVALFAEGDAHRVERTVTFSRSLSDAQRARLLEIADRSPVTRLLHRAVAIATTFLP